MQLTPTVLTVDQGGTKILIAECDQAGHLFNSRKYPSDVSDQHAATKQIQSAIAEYLKEPHHGDIKAISISTVGRIDSETGIWYEINPDHPTPVALADIIQKQFELPTYIGNDVYSATVAEQAFGIGQTTDNFIYLNVGTGIAGRVVTNGQIVQGAHSDAGEIGHMVVDFNSKEQCICGRFGCVEPIASGLGMSRATIEKINAGEDTSLKIDDHGRVGTEQLFPAYDAGDKVAREVVDRALSALACLILNLIRVSDPEAVVLGGGVTNGDWLMTHLKPLLGNAVTHLMKVGVVKSQLDPNQVAIMGASRLGFVKGGLL
ncbi:ROK family protein [Lacticaseibacillus porcinae]|uniref:ROK family protein n=1 Tax=Lacticaseibacillus porcinae TaxID=1123687 RepID=UPI000F7800CE|nr:ROK family protein [Lacticaseibacillus porcinae]